MAGAIWQTRVKNDPKIIYCPECTKHARLSIVMRRDSMPSPQSISHLHIWCVWACRRISAAWFASLIIGCVFALQAHGATVTSLVEHEGALPHECKLLQLNAGANHCAVLVSEWMRCDVKKQSSVTNTQMSCVLIAFVSEYLKVIVSWGKRQLCCLFEYNINGFHHLLWI